MMSWFTRRFQWVFLAVLWLGSVAFADPLTTPTWTLDELPTTVRSVTERPPLVDIPGPLTQLFPFLRNFSSQVRSERARGDADALNASVQQLSFAMSLGQSEQLSADSDALLAEATDIAWEQRDPEALRQSLALWSNPVRSGRSQEQILQTRERLDDVERERTEMLQRRRCRLIFHNRTELPVQLSINRKPMGILNPGETQEIADLLAGRQHLTANHEGLQWGPRQVYVGPGEVFNWRLFN